ncbi:MAG: carboxymuconolactone decarboxylase family protein [Phycisphaerae bacterium]|nr:carboxymuconolactone decarboxylase family protein [Phycisphaerae bacterium]
MPIRRRTSAPGTKRPRSAPASPRLPGTFREFLARHPELGACHERVARAVERAGPLDARTLSLVKIGISIGAGLESALRSHVRRALEHGATELEIEQAILLGMNTVGFPRTVAAWSWAREQFARRP